MQNSDTKSAVYAEETKLETSRELSVAELDAVAGGNTGARREKPDGTGCTEGTKLI